MLSKNKYKNPLDAYEDLTLVFLNAMYYNEEGSQIAKDASTLRVSTSISVHVSPNSTAETVNARQTVAGICLSSAAADLATCIVRTEETE